MTIPVAPLACLSCPGRMVRIRGLCVRCYHRLGDAVRRGETTWAALEAIGRALAPQPRGLVWRKWFSPRNGDGPK